MPRFIRSVFAASAGATALLVAVVASAAPPLPGAIFTTDINGDLVNGNVQYEAKCDVYLDGGPGPNAPQQAAGLPDGDYYYQVTDPSGKKLLSTDLPENRCFTVEDGIITAQCAVPMVHGTGVSNDHGGITIQLCPYEDTPNNGGVYKVWATPVDDFDGDPAQSRNNCGNGCFHGFLPAASKTDNFKVGDADETYCIEAYKYTVDKKKSGGLIPLEGWQIFFGGNTYYTNADGMVEICGLVAGNYSIEEATEYKGVPALVLFSLVNGDEVQPPSAAVTISVGHKNDPNPGVVEWVNVPSKK